MKPTIPTTNPAKVTTLKEGQVSAYTACRECGKRFTQKNPARFRALATLLQRL